MEIVTAAEEIVGILCRHGDLLTVLRCLSECEIKNLGLNAFTNKNLYPNFWYNIGRIRLGVHTVLHLAVMRY